MNTKLIAIAALSSFAAFGAHAFQGEQNPLPPKKFESTLSRAEVKSEARTPVMISNGGTGVLVINSEANRSNVRAAALAITSEGAATYGEM